MPAPEHDPIGSIWPEGSAGDDTLGGNRLRLDAAGATVSGAAAVIGGGGRPRGRRLGLETPRLLQTVRSLSVIRWFAAAWAVVQVVTYYRPYPEGILPWALAAVAVLFAGNTAIWVFLRRAHTAADARRLALGSLLVDGVSIVGLVFVYTFDTDTAIWAVLYIIPLGAAALFQLRGALWTMGAVTVAYALREVWGNAEYGNELLPVSISFRMGVGFVIAGFAGAMASGLVSRLGELRVLNRITQTVAGERDLQAALAVVAEETLSVISARACAIALVDRDRRRMAIVASSGKAVEGTAFRDGRFSVDASPALAELVAGAAPVTIAGPADPAAGPEISLILDERGGRSLLLVPLPVRSTTIGAIVLESEEAGRAFGAGDVSLAETVAGQIAGAIENARLFDELLEYVDQVGVVTDAASAVESGRFEVDGLDAVGRRDDALGQLARVFQGMVREVAAREQRLRREVQQLRIEIDETRTARQVDEITESEYFRRLQAKVDQLRVDTNG